MPIINYIRKGLMGEYDNPGQPEKKKEFHWLTFDAMFFWMIEICELCKWCFQKINFRKKYMKDEMNEIFSELHSAPQTFKYAINVYKSLPKDHPERKVLAQAIRDAKDDFTKLDVLLEDMQLDVEYEEIKEKENEKKYTNPGYSSFG